MSAATGGAGSERERLEATVRGLVQGVGFRWYVVRVAQDLGLDGWVSNAPDGSVLVIAEGRPRVLDLLLEAIQEGPPAAAVSQVQVRRGPPAGIPGGFIIRAGAHRGD